ncbi:unnamed protein product [Candidula unifasciata]|uniref:Methyltransferase domain-containing protein n=1 Tax=Candidula unifasciata TaxID=100452 RepID=A0A8S3YHZ1_9EUPU|nr:unnamed protein product [Candidula unifasciata]
MTLYLQGCLTEDGESILCPLSSSVILFFIRYCQTNQFELVFVPDSAGSINMCCSFQRNILSGLSVRFTPWTEVPSVVRNVLPPSLHQPELSLVRSGMCVLLRHIIRESDTFSPDLHLIDLLGFRQGSMRMCSEVSGFTKLCEVELPDSVSQFVSTLRTLFLEKADGGESSGSRQVILPSALIKLDDHFRKNCRVHNDNKRRREELSKLKNYLRKVSSSKVTNATNIPLYNIAGRDPMFIETCEEQLSLQKCLSLEDSCCKSSEHSTDLCPNEESFNIRLDVLSQTDSWLQIDHVTQLHHGIHRLKVDKHFDVSSVRLNAGNDGAGKTIQDWQKVEFTTVMTASGCLKGSNRNSTFNAAVLTDISELVDQLTHLDIQYEHTYSEGVEMTLADLILYVYTYHLLEALHFRSALLVDHIPSVLHWVDHMTSLATVVKAGQRSGWDMERLLVGLGTGLTKDGTDKISGCLNHSREIVFVKEPELPQDAEEDEMELSRCARMKHKALKPDVTEALQKFELANLRPVIGSHPCGADVGITWDHLPAGVHPREGDVPKSRTERKCQQLENLVTAVQTLYTPGDVLVDFCSGGGHLGIILAYLLPDCQVYLVENKEESLLKACSRLHALALTNVTMYQCNLDYFIGTFDVGVCLHACGSATDMVLQLCLDCQASFVICPCCYGSIQKTHLLSYPQSQQFVDAGISYKDFLTLGHAADQTEFNIALEAQGRLCMNLVDTDRAEHAREVGYLVTLCMLTPPACSPKNNLLLGTTRQR